MLYRIELIVCLSLSGHRTYLHCVGVNFNGSRRDVLASELVNLFRLRWSFQTHVIVFPVFAVCFFEPCACIILLSVRTAELFFKFWLFFSLMGVYTRVKRFFCWKWWDQKLSSCKMNTIICKKISVLKVNIYTALPPPNYGFKVWIFSSFWINLKKIIFRQFENHSGVLKIPTIYAKRLILVFLS